METTATVAAPAQPDVSVTISAADDAIQRGDFPALQSARRAERTGQPLPSVDATAEPASPVSEPAPAAPENRKTRAEKEQERINTSIREAIVAATAPLKAEIARLQPPTPEPAATAPPAQKTPEWKRYAGLPDAPKLAEFDSVEDHTAAMSFFIAKTMFAEQQQHTDSQREDASRAEALDKQGATFSDRLHKAKEADPDFDTKITPSIAHARPLSGGFVMHNGELVNRFTGEKAQFKNFIAETLFQSEDPGALVNHLHSHPEDFGRIQDLEPTNWSLALARLDGRLAGAAKQTTSPAAPGSPAAATPSTIANVPPPPPTVSNKAGATADPATAAMQRGDFVGYQAARRAERIASARGGM